MYLSVGKDCAYKSTFWELNKLDGEKFAFSKRQNLLALAAEEVIVVLFNEETTRWPVAATKKFPK